MTDIFNTTIPDIGRTYRILNFIKNSGELFIAIGKPTIWATEYGLEVSDSNPPVPGSNIIEIPEPIIYKRIQRALPAIPSTMCADLNLDIDSNISKSLTQSNIEKSYVLFNVEDLFEEDGSVRLKPSHIYISASIESEDYNADSFRCIGLYNSVQLKGGVNDNKLVYTNNEISVKALQWVSYSTPIERNTNKVHNIEILLQI